MRFCILVATLFVFAQACAPREVVDLVGADSWTLVEEGARHVFNIQEDKGLSRCNSEGFGTEATIFEIDTGICDYVTFSQPTKAAIHRGDVIRFTGWHLILSLDGEEREATGYMGLAIADTMVFEYETDIPADEEVIVRDLIANEDIETGTPIYLHVHNHGDNSWRVLSVESGPEELL